MEGIPVLLAINWIPVLVNTFTEGFIYAAMALGIYLALRVAGFPDLTITGSFAFGGAVAAVAITSWGWNPFLATFAGFLGGIIPGLITAFLNRSLYIADLISGIITATFFFTVTRRWTGSATEPVSRDGTIYSSVGQLATTIDLTMLRIVVAGTLSFLLGLLLWWFLRTQLGLAMRATGSSEQMATSLGISTTRMVYLALGLGNGLVGLSGAMVVQRQGFSDVNMGTGIIVAGLGTVMLGEALFGRNRVWRGMMACVVGSLVYRFIVSFALAAGLQPSDILGASAVLLTLILVLPQSRALVERILHLGTGPERPKKTVLRRR